MRILLHLLLPVLLLFGLIALGQDGRIGSQPTIQVIDAGTNAIQILPVEAHESYGYVAPDTFVSIKLSDAEIDEVMQAVRNEGFILEGCVSFIGYEQDGERLVSVSWQCLDLTDRHAQRLMVMDGGEANWSADYDLDRHEWSHIEYGGEA